METFRNTMSSEDFEWNVLDKLKGLSVLIQGLEFADEAGATGFEKQAHRMLSDVTQSIIKEAEYAHKLIMEMDRELEELQKNQGSKTINIHM